MRGLFFLVEAKAWLYNSMGIAAIPRRRISFPSDPPRRELALEHEGVTS